MYDRVANASRTRVFGHQPKLKNETTQSNGRSKKPKGATHDQISFVRHFLLSPGPSPGFWSAETDRASIRASLAHRAAVRDGAPLIDHPTG